MCMSEDGLRRRQASGHEQSRPVDGVEAKNILSDNVNVCRPGASYCIARLPRVARDCEIIGQRIDPDIHDVAIAAGHLDAPVETGAADRQIVEAAGDETDDLVAPGFGTDEIGVGVVEIEQRLHGNVPFEVVSCRMSFKVSRDGQTQDEGTITLILAEVGKGAKSELPDSN